MKILLYNALVENNIPNFAKFRSSIENDNFAQADVIKVGKNLYRSRLNRSDRLLFSFYRYDGVCYCLVLEFIANHAYEKSRFLNRGVDVEDSRIPAVSTVEDIEPEELNYLNPQNNQVNWLDKILSFDTEQNAIYQLQPPLVVIGSAGSGKSALTLEKMKKMSGDVLYLSLSPYLVQNARNIYFSNDYNNDDQQVEFLSFREFLESIRVPQGREITLREFSQWFERHKSGTGLKDPHALFEEFRGVITGPAREAPWLSREDYLNLGVKQSIFIEEDRAKVYTLFEKYRDYLEQQGHFDPNMISHNYLSLVEARYDFIVIDEVQDMTPVQLFLSLKSLRHQGQFMLCGDSNQIVHPNFFSWSSLKTLFFDQRELTSNAEVIRILHNNYRNAKEITELANRLLKLKHARFGSIDKESHYLVNSAGKQKGSLQLITDNDRNKQDLNHKTARSTQFAVLVMHPQQKEEAKRWFNTPLVFSIQEAKGLEYDNVILYNFISGEDKLFRTIISDIDPAVLDKQEISYARAKNKRDKSLEIYKFFINALYVAITRAVKNLYFVEANHKHDLVRLLNLDHYSGELSVEQQNSSLEDWQKEAKRLAMQGKEEQAEAIRQNILQEKPVPWPIFNRDNAIGLFDKLKSETSQQKKLNKKESLKLLEYAVLYHHKPIRNFLLRLGFRPANQPEEKALKQLYNNHYINYTMNNPNAALREAEMYGVDHRTVFNLTPLMLAAKIGNSALVDTLIKRGADTGLTASNGFMAQHLVLEELLFGPTPAKNKKLSAIFHVLQPDSVSIQVDGQLKKLDKRLMGLFLFNMMIAMHYRELGNVVSLGNGFNAKLLAQLGSSLPDSVLPEKRKRQTYISSVLSSNEVNRDGPYNRKLFLRLKRGNYIVNPDLKLRQGEDWIPIFTLLNLDDLSYDELGEEPTPGIPPRIALEHLKRITQFRESELLNFKEHFKPNKCEISVKGVSEPQNEHGQLEEVKEVV